MSYNLPGMIKGEGNVCVKSILYGPPGHNPFLFVEVTIPKRVIKYNEGQIPVVEYIPRKQLTPIPVVNFTPGENPNLLTLNEDGLKKTSIKLAEHLGAEPEVILQDLESIIRSLRGV